MFITKEIIMKKIKKKIVLKLKIENDYKVAQGVNGKD